MLGFAPPFSLVRILSLHLWMNKSCPVSLPFSLWLVGVSVGGGLVDDDFENLNFRVRGTLSRECCVGSSEGRGEQQIIGRTRVTLGLGGPCSYMEAVGALECQIHPRHYSKEERSLLAPGCGGRAADLGLAPAVRAGLTVRRLRPCGGSCPVRTGIEGLGSRHRVGGVDFGWDCEGPLHCAEQSP